MRAPGMSLMKMPIFTWMVLVVQFLLVFAIPVITVALFLLMFQREFGATFFAVEAGADPLLWQHLFWIFGHPEVYILVLPCFGIVSEVLPVFSRKPLFGYPFVVFSGAAIGFVGWGVWAHHMFASGLGPISVAVFSVVDDGDRHPDRRQDRQLDDDDVGRQAPVHHGDAVRDRPDRASSRSAACRASPTPWRRPTRSRPTPTTSSPTSTTCCSAAPCSGFFAGLYYWWPKIFGKMLSEKLGKWNFWLMVIGMNLTFGPMHIVGLQGQPRRMYQHHRRSAPAKGSSTSASGTWSRRSASFILAIGVLLFVVNVSCRTARARRRRRSTRGTPAASSG